MLKILVGQINPTVGDLRGNLRLMAEAARGAREAGAQLVVFPELSLTGYYPGDMLEDPAFLREVETIFGELLAASCAEPGVHWVVGLPVRRSGVGRPLYNALRVVRAGEVLLEYAKQLLPAHKAFDERRHFAPGPDVARVLQVGEARVGFLICEDGWNDRGGAYPVNPLARLQHAQPDLVVAINASTSHIVKREQRHANFSAAAARHGVPILYVNQVGGQDELVFDGGSFAVEADGRVAWEAARFEVACPTVGLHGGRFLVDGAAPAPVPALGLGVLEFYRRQIVLGIRDYARRCGFRQAVVGVQGDVDSALTLALAVEALGAANVAALAMPAAGESVADARLLCRNLGVALHEHPIGEIVASLQAGLGAAFEAPLAGRALDKLRDRARGTLLMAFCDRFGHLLLTAGNKSALCVGRFTLHGDTHGGLAPVGDLYRSEVVALASYLNVMADRETIPSAIVDRPPAQDSDGLPPVEQLDPILKLHIEGPRLPAEEREAAQAVVQGLAASREGAALIARVHGLVARNEYKRRQAPPVIRVRARAFGSGREMPIAAQHRDAD